MGEGRWELTKRSLDPLTFAMEIEPITIIISARLFLQCTICSQYALFTLGPQLSVLLSR
jgi:hypothetical protein